MAGQGPCQTGRQEEHAQAVEAGTCGLGRIEHYCPDMQRCNSENQGADGTASGEECVK